MTRRRRRALGVLAAFAASGCTAILGIPEDVDHHGPRTDGGDETTLSDVTIPEGGRDASTDAGDAKADAVVVPPACDIAKDFGTPVVVPVISTGEDEGSARFSEDELTLLFDARRGSNDFNVYVATRTSLSAQFGNPIAIAGVSTLTDDEYAPNLTTNQLTIFYERQTALDKISRILRAKRATNGAAFGTGEILNINSNVYTANPFVRGDGTELWYVSVVAAGGPVEVFQGTATPDGGFIGTSQTPLNIGIGQFDPVISKDGLTIYFASDKAVAGLAGLNIWVAKRANRMSAFGTPILVPNVNTASSETPTWVSGDGCRLYISSDRPGGPGKQDVYVATRPK